MRLSIFYAWKYSLEYKKMIRKNNYKIYVSQKHMITLRVFNLAPETMSITLTSINKT